MTANVTQYTIHNPIDEDTFLQYTKMAQEDVFLEKLWDIGNFSIAGVIDAAMNFAVLAEIFHWAFHSNDGPIRFIIAFVGVPFFVSLIFSYYLSFLQMINKKEWAEVLTSNDTFYMFCTPQIAIYFHTIGFNTGSTVGAFFFEGAFADSVAWTKLVCTLYGIANTEKTVRKVLSKNSGYAVSSSGNHTNDINDSV